MREDEAMVENQVKKLEEELALKNRVVRQLLVVAEAHEEKIAVLEKAVSAAQSERKEGQLEEAAQKALDEANRRADEADKAGKATEEELANANRTMGIMRTERESLRGEVEKLRAALNTREQAARPATGADAGAGAAPAKEEPGQNPATGPVAGRVVDFV